MSSLINIGKRRELFWDDYIIDTDKTTAFHRINKPVLDKKPCFVFDQEQWLENPSISYPNIVKVGDVYRLYYSPWTSGFALPYVIVCVIESTDGINWHRPHLNIFDHPDLKENNIVLDGIIDSAFVFLDTNPDCKPEEKFKAVGKASGTHNGKENVEGLWCWTSSDGYHFKLSHLLTDNGRFDSLNTVFWKDGKYYCYFRDFHNIIPGKPISTATRDIRVMYSEDMINWTEQKMISFNDDNDIALYTNNIIPYERAPHVLVGFPVRYIERSKITKNIQQLPSYEAKKKITSICEQQFDIDRMCLVNTDCIFMCSRDGENWYRDNEVFVAGAYEDEFNWIYGDAYLAYDFIDSGKDTYYFYAIDKHFELGLPKDLLRYEIRKDGFSCIMAGAEEKVVVTKPIVFDGSVLHLNFESSAYGYIVVDVLDEEGNPMSDKKSFEVFGNTLDRTVLFEDDSDFAEFAGKPIRLRFTMRDAKLYSMKFE